MNTTKHRCSWSKFNDNCSVSIYKFGDQFQLCISGHFLNRNWVSYDWFDNIFQAREAGEEVLDLFKDM